MPTKSRVSGVMVDANLDPIVGGKVIATLNGSDYFDGGTKIVTQRLDATTDEAGAWSLDLIVNAEGEDNKTTWTLEGYNHQVAKVFTASNLFIATADPIQLSELEKLSAFNLRAANDATFAQLIVVDSFAEYLALPAGQRRDSDLIIQPLED